MNSKTILKTISTVGILALAAPAFAMVQYDAEGNIISNTGSDSGEIRIQTTGSVDAEPAVLLLETATAGIEATSEMVNNVAAEVDATVETMNDVQVEATVDANAEIDSTESANHNTTRSRSSLKIMVNGSIVAADATLVGRITAPSGVSSEQDFAAYVQLVANTNEQISSVEGSDSKVEVRYSSAVTVLGFITTNMEYSAIVKADESGDSRVSVSKPWWSVFVTSETTSSADLQADLESRVDGSISGRTSFDMQTQAEIVALAEQAFSAAVSADAAVDVQ